MYIKLVISKPTKTRTMSMKEIDNENTTKAYATRENVYTMHMIQIHTKKHIERDPSTMVRTIKRV